MKSTTYPLPLPEDLYAEVKRTAEQTGLSLADALRQATKLGLPALKEKLAPGISSEAEAQTAIKAVADWLDRQNANWKPPPRPAGADEPQIAETVRKWCQELLDSARAQGY